MKNFKLFEIKSFLDQKRGTLFAYDKIFKNHKIKNAFVVSANKNFLRGGHAHKKASQFIVCLEGKIKISITSKLSTSIVILKESERTGYLAKRSALQAEMHKIDAILAESDAEECKQRAKQEQRAENIRSAS